MTTLSGRVDTIEAQAAFLAQDLLQKVDINSMSQLSITWNQQYDELANSITLMQASLQTLQSLYINLKNTVSTNFSLFTGHTGDTSLHN